MRRIDAEKSAFVLAVSGWVLEGFGFDAGCWPFCNGDSYRFVIFGPYSRYTAFSDGAAQRPTPLLHQSLESGPGIADLGQSGLGLREMICGQQSRGFCGPVDSDTCKADGQRGILGGFDFVAGERTMPFIPGIVIANPLFSERPTPFGWLALRPSPLFPSRSGEVAPLQDFAHRDRVFTVIVPPAY